jgi:hypothetical protein
MKFKSQVYTQASGSIGGVTYSHNRFGMYTRGKVIPVNPNTALQQAARTRLAIFAANWKLLTAEQRQAWAAWAAVVLKTNPLGDQVTLTAFNWYVAVNAQRAQVGGLGQISVPDPALALTTFSTISVVIAAAGNSASVSFANTDPWATAVGGFMNIFAALPVPQTRNFLSGPFRLIGTVPGAVVPPTSPVVLPLGYDVSVGQKVFIRGIVQNSLGAPSNQQIVAGVAI